MMTLNFKRSCVLSFLLLAVLTVGFYGRESAAAGVNTKKAQTPTYNKEVARLMQKHCQSCHHPGDIAPFSLTNFEETRPWARAIREAVISKEMPPWKPLAGCGDFKDARSLTQDEINTFTAWADGGAPEGSAADLPAPMQFTEGWPLGKPDFIASLPEPFTPPLGKDTYRCFSVPTASLRGDRWAQGLDVQPGNRKIVHHVIAYADPTGKSIALDAKEAGPGYTCFGGPGFSINLTDVDILNGNGASAFDVVDFTLGGTVLSVPPLFFGADPFATIENPYKNYEIDITSIISAPGTYTLRFANVESIGTLVQGIDNVSINATPEPSSSILIFGSFVFFILRRQSFLRKHRHQCIAG